MFVIDDIVIIGSLIGVFVVPWAVEKWKIHRLRKKCSEFLVEPPFTAQDEDLVKKCRGLMAEEFPNGIETRLKGMSVEDRAKLFKRITLKLKSIYGVELNDIVFMNNDEIDSANGYFDPATNNIVFNIDIIACNDPEIMHMIVGTIFHECRHALQHRAVRDTSCNFGSEEQRRLWALNFVNYISPETDFALYQLQVVEADARFFAEKVLENY